VPFLSARTPAGHDGAGPSHVEGFDLSDANKRRLFPVNLLTGSLVGAPMDLTTPCDSCAAAADNSGNLYLTDLIGKKIRRFKCAF
jgi:hypothetical protein